MWQEINATHLRVKLPNRSSRCRWHTVVTVHLIFPSASFRLHLMFQCIVETLQARSGCLQTKSAPIIIIIWWCCLWCLVGYDMCVNGMWGLCFYFKLVSSLNDALKFGYIHGEELTGPAYVPRLLDSSFFFWLKKEVHYYTGHFNKACMLVFRLMILHTLSQQRYCNYRFSFSRTK